MRRNIAQLSAATFTSIVGYLEMPIWQLIEIMDDVEYETKRMNSRRKK